MRGTMGSLTMGGLKSGVGRGGRRSRISHPNGIAAVSLTTPCHQDAGRKRPPAQSNQRAEPEARRTRNITGSFARRREL